MQFGIDCLLNSQELQKELKGKKVALVGHPASLTSKMLHSLDALLGLSNINLCAAFGPQHGMKGDKQYNMRESASEFDKERKLQIFSLYGDVRRPTEEMMKSFDTILVDLQDIGTRIYTYVATLLYLMEECSQKNKSLWVLDRPNPAGRPIEGNFLKEGWKSYVGATYFPMRHGLTMGEIALYMKKKHQLDLDLKIVKMDGYNPIESPGFGWPLNLRAFVNPSPNITTISAVRAYPGTVLIEATNLNEGRGTTRPLEIIGAPQINSLEVLNEMKKMAPHWMQGTQVRHCFFEPTYYKHKGELCSGIQFHLDNDLYEHEKFSPMRFILLFFKTLKKTGFSNFQWRDPGYEYDFERMPIDLLCGSDFPRKWVDDDTSKADELDEFFGPDEKAWKEERKEFLLY